MARRPRPRKAKTQVSAMALVRLLMMMGMSTGRYVFAPREHRLTLSPTSLREIHGAERINYLTIKIIQELTMNFLSDFSQAPCPSLAIRQRHIRQYPRILRLQWENASREESTFLSCKPSIRQKHSPEHQIRLDCSPQQLTILSSQGIALPIEQFNALIDLLPQIEKALQPKAGDLKISRPRYDDAASAATTGETEKGSKDSVDNDEDENEAKDDKKKDHDERPQKRQKQKANHEATSSEDEG
jgi:hypothetical protein